MPHRAVSPQLSELSSEGSSAGSSTLDISDSSAAAAAAAPYSFLVLFARSSILSVLRSAIVVGHMRIEDRDETFHFGTPASDKTGSGGGSVVRLKVHNGRFWTRVFAAGDLGFSEAYMIGDVEIENLKSIMDLWLDNESTVSAVSSLLARAFAAASALRNAFFGQTRTRARLNVIASYDTANELFMTFLSREMMYSCALWGDSEGGVRGDLLLPSVAAAASSAAFSSSSAFPTSSTSHSNAPPHECCDASSPLSRALAEDGDALERAQMRKIHHVLRAARVKPGDRVLEFGTGWGGLAIEAAATYGCEVDTLTLSVEQKTLAEERARERGVAGRVHVHLMDYRDVPRAWAGRFDAFISVEMLEHVGSKYYKRYFELVDFALKPAGATAVVTCSTFPEGRYTGYQAEDFMRRYMWPNSCLPSATVLIDAAYAASRGRFTLEGVENHASHYPRTLRTWSRRLLAHAPELQDALAARYPALRARATYGEFLRKWEYLFAYAGAGFAKGYITCHMLTFVRSSDVMDACD
ncbi:cyclopropane-fatty-acyl-phospholipid synthase [Lenzites betulinus]|nr:cyclopropane-fatty-acyl-phospholipid synthase [Lenzites betulinus]